MQGPVELHPKTTGLLQKTQSIAPHPNRYSAPRRLKRHEGSRVWEFDVGNSMIEKKIVYWWKVGSGGKIGRFHRNWR